MVSKFSFYYVLQVCLATVVAAATPCYAASLEIGLASPTVGSGRVEAAYGAIKEVLSGWNEHREAIDFNSPHYVSYNGDHSVSITKESCSKLQRLLKSSWGNSDFNFSLEQYRFLLPLAIASSCVPLVEWIVLRCPGLFEGWGEAEFKKAQSREGVICRLRPTYIPPFTEELGHHVCFVKNMILFAMNHKWGATNEAIDAFLDNPVVDAEGKLTRALADLLKPWSYVVLTGSPRVDIIMDSERDLAAFQVFVKKYVGREDVVSAGRRATGLDSDWERACASCPPLL